MFSRWNGFVGNPRMQVSGYTNHRWNGVTTLHLTRICHDIIKHRLSLPGVWHVVPTDILPKEDLLRCFAREYRRKDVTITPCQAKTVIDRTLGTKTIH